MLPSAQHTHTHICHEIVGTVRMLEASRLFVKIVGIVLATLHAVHKLSGKGRKSQTTGASLDTECSVTTAETST